MYAGLGASVDIKRTAFLLILNFLRGKAASLPVLMLLLQAGSLLFLLLPSIVRLAGLRGCGSFSCLSA